MRLERSDHAVSDLRAISEYIEQDHNLETANRVTRIIYDASGAFVLSRTRADPAVLRTHVS